MYCIEALMVSFIDSTTSIYPASVLAALTWENIRNSYYQFFMTDTTIAFCLMVYVVITLFIIAFLLQPKAARTWVRPGKTPEGQPPEKLASQAQIADLCGAPVLPASGSPAKGAGQADSATKAMPSAARHERVTLHAAPATRGSAAILYITDNDSSEHLQDSLGAAGMAVISSPPGKEAVRNISVTKFDAIVIDTLVAEAARLCATQPQE
jgi:hypothetical protein